MKVKLEAREKLIWKGQENNRERQGKAARHDFY
jgi:hypothetical protein